MKKGWHASRHANALWLFVQHSPGLRDLSLQSCPQEADFLAAVLYLAGQWIEGTPKAQLVALRSTPIARALHNGRQFKPPKTWYKAPRANPKVTPMEAANAVIGANFGDVADALGGAVFKLWLWGFTIRELGNAFGGTDKDVIAMLEDFAPRLEKHLGWMMWEQNFEPQAIEFIGATVFEERLRYVAHLEENPVAFRHWPRVTQASKAAIRNGTLPRRPGRTEPPFSFFRPPRGKVKA